ncbi:hypothetical protein JCM11641_003600 [Rhodosporidiobolus odoratus]
MEAPIAAPHLPSPTKKPALDTAPFSSPEGIRGSMARAAQTAYVEQIKAQAMHARAAVSRGHQTSTTSNSRRPLGFSRTEPVLSFAQKIVPSAAGNFQTAKDVLDLVYESSEGFRAHELQPFGGSQSDVRSQRSRAATAVPGHDSGVWGAGTSAAPTKVEEEEEEDGDGFDVDDVFGASGSGSHLNFGFLGGGAAGASSSNGLKRDFDTAEQGPAAEDDEDMAATDVEDDQVEPMAPPRRTAGIRKGWTRTQSLPASAFAGNMEF